MGKACSTHERDAKCIALWSENLKGRDHSEDVLLDGRIILEWILKNTMGGSGLNSCGSGQGPVADSLFLRR